MFFAAICIANYLAESRAKAQTWSRPTTESPIYLPMPDPSFMFNENATPEDFERYQKQCNEVMLFNWEQSLKSIERQVEERRAEHRRMAEAHARQLEAHARHLAACFHPRRDPLIFGAQ